MTEPRRIRPPKRHEDLIDRLVTENIFDTKQAVMMFAASLGYRLQSRKTLDSGAEGIRRNIFENNQDDAFINALALAERKEVSVLDPEANADDEVVTIFEEYATGGLEYLERYVKDTPGDILDNLLALLQQYRTSRMDTLPGLDGLDRNTLELLGDLDQ